MLPVLVVPLLVHTLFSNKIYEEMLDNSTIVTCENEQHDAVEGTQFNIQSEM
jgi:hypothetical protein